MDGPLPAPAYPVSGRASHAKVALVLALAGGASALLLVPYALAVSRSPLRTLGLPLPIALAISCAQSTGVLFLLAWAGLALGERIGLGAPVLRAWLSKGSVRLVPARWVLAVALGVAAGVSIVLLDALLFQRGVAASLARAAAEAPRVARWKGALACFYGGIAEEVQLRLFFMTAVAWCLGKVTRSSRRAVLVAANVIAALVFGAGHLPLAARVFGLSALVVVRTIALNALGGVVFGALYGRWGLEHAMVAHFCADVVLHVAVGG